MKPEISHLFYLQKLDFRSVFGSNCKNLCRECGVTFVDKINRNNINMPIKIHTSQEWRIPFLNDLIVLRDNPIVDIPVNDLNQIFFCML